MSELLLTAILVVLALMVLVSGALVALLLTKERNPKGWPLARRMAKEILAGEIPEDVKPFTVSPSLCKNCNGKRPVRWAVAEANAYLRRKYLATAISGNAFCFSCLEALARLSKPKKATAEPISKDGKDAKKSPTLARYVGKGLAAIGFAITLIFALNAFFVALYPSEVIRASGVFGMLHSFGAFAIAVLLGGISIILLRQLTK